MDKFNGVVAGILAEGLDDYVMLDSAIWLAREHSGILGMDFRETLSDVFDFLLSRQLIELGSLEEEGFSAWIGTKNELVGRAISECSSFNWEPLGAGFWIRNTPLGDAAARSIDGNKSV